MTTERRHRARRLAPLGLLVVLAAALIAAPGIARWDGEGPAAEDARRLAERIDALPPGALAVVAFDADLASYAEVRPAARRVLEALIAAGARLAVVSFTPEGRALAAAELARLGGAPLDIGFVPGGEAGLVASVRRLVPDRAEGAVAEAARAGGGGLAAFALAVVVGGGDIGPRTWVEQVGPRVPDLPIAAVVPAFQRPQLEPYRASEQLVALVAGPSAALAMEGADAGPAGVADAVLAGMLVAIGALLVTGLGPHLRRPVAGGREAEEGE